MTPGALGQGVISDEIIIKTGISQNSDLANSKYGKIRSDDSRPKDSEPIRVFHTYPYGICYLFMS